jgi:hypothetical protein
MVLKSLLIVIIFAILMEDGSSIKKFEEEKREDKELAELVNKTLAEEAEKKEEEEKKKRQLDPEKKRDETKKKKDEKDEKKKTVETGIVVEEDKDEAFPSSNCTDSCPTPIECEQCPECPTVRCNPCKKCPEPKEEDCPPCRPCRPCGPCPVVNSTVPDLPPTSACPEAPGMSLPAAVAVGVAAGILLTGVATTFGVLLRYLSPIESGLIFLATIIFVWYLCSHHPETARELGGRAATLLREAATALSHRVVEALRHHNEQVDSSIFLLVFSLPI